MSYEIALSFNNQAEGFNIPVMPPSIEINEGGQGRAYNIVGPGGGTEETRAGEVNVIRNPKLREVSFSSIFPADIYPFVSQQFPVFVPMHYIRHIEKWMASKHPIRFIFAGSYKELTSAQKIENLTDINFPASVESFVWREKAGSPGDIEYTLKLKEYVFYSPRKVITYTDANGVTQQKLAPPPRPDERIRPETYTLKASRSLTEALMEASKRWYGDTVKWRDLADLNGFSSAEQMKPVAEGVTIKLIRS